MISWKNIPDTNNRYKISNNGEIYDNIKKKVLNPTLLKRYMRISLIIKTKKTECHIHRLVYKIFKGGVINSQHIYHIDADVHNNNINNLKLRKLNKCKKICKKINDPPKLPNEIWKDIDGYQNRYKISNFGQLYSIMTDKLLTIG